MDNEHACEYRERMNALELENAKLELENTKLKAEIEEYKKPPQAGQIHEGTLYKRFLVIRA